jgi:hypothetical protein
VEGDRGQGTGHRAQDKDVKIIRLGRGDVR